MAKERIIYDNYDVCTMFDDARAFLLEDHEEEEITDSMVWEEVSFQDSLNWQDENERLTDFFTGHGFFLIRGFVGRWNGDLQRVPFSITGSLCLQTLHKIAIMSKSGMKTDIFI